MVWPIPAPGDVAARAASVFESDLPRVYALRNPGAPHVIVDARSNTSQLAVYARTVDAAVQDQWMFQARNALELMPDTALDWLPRHGAIWNIPQILAQPATGNIVIPAVAGTAIPAGFAVTAPGGQLYTTTVAGTAGSGGTVSIPVIAAVAGSGGSQAPGTVLTVVSPLAGLIIQPGQTTQTVTVDASGLTGEDAETTDAWRARILTRVRNRGSGGNANDFQNWAEEALPGMLVKAMSPGAGFVTVAFAMPSGQTWRAATGAEISTVTAYLNDAQTRKPLACPVVLVVAATLQPVNFTLHLNQDTTANRAGATNALSLQVLSDATIGGTLYVSRLQAALQNDSGAYSDDLSAPSADVTAGATTLSVMGTVTFT